MLLIWYDWQLPTVILGATWSRHYKIDWFCGIHEGIHHENTQKRLLSEAYLTLKKAIEVACNMRQQKCRPANWRGKLRSKQCASYGSRPLPRKGMEDCQRYYLINVESAGGANHKAKDHRLENAECYKCHRTGYTCWVHVDQLQLTQAGEILNMLDGLKSPHNRTIMLTVPFFKFQGNLLTHLQWS